MADVPPPFSTRPPAHVPHVELPGLQALTTLAAGVVVVAALYLARDVLVPITLAILLSFVLAPLVGLLRRARLGRVPAVVLAVVLALGVILALGGLIGTQVAELATEIPRYAATIEDKVDSVRHFALGTISEMVGRLGRQIEQATSTPPPAGQPPPGSAITGTEQKPLPVEVRQPNATPVELAERIISPVLSPLATFGIVFIVAIFILLQQEDLRDRLIRLFGSSDLHRTTVAMDDAARRLSRYFLTQLGINAAFGVHHRHRPVLDRRAAARCSGACSRRCCASCPISARSSPAPCPWRWPPPSIRAGPW